MSFKDQNQGNAQPDKAFWDRADGLIDVANNQMQNGVSADDVSISFMFAAARFKAFSVYNSGLTPETLKSEKEEIIDYLTEQFRLMLNENMEEHSKHEG